MQMVTVVNGGALAGYSAWDHLVEGGDIAALIGRQYRCAADALRAAEARCWIGEPGSGSPQRRRNHPYIWLEVQMSSGAIRRVQSTEGLR
jgi:hypothetical protein